MNLTKHAKERSKQRGVTRSSIDVLLEYGSLEYAPGGVYRVVLRRKELQEIVSRLKRALRMVEKARDGVLVVDESKIITVYKRH